MKSERLKMCFSRSLFYDRTPITKQVLYNHDREIILPNILLQNLYYIQPRMPLRLTY